MSRRTAGTILVAVSALAFGLMALFRDLAVQSGADTETTLFLRFAFAAPVLVGIAILTRQRFPRGWLLVGVMAMGGVLYFAEAWTHYKAMEYIPSGLNALLLYLYPGIVAILARVVLREKLTPAKLVAILLATAGLVLTLLPEVLEEGGLAGRPRDVLFKGITLGVAAAVCYAVYILIGARLARGLDAIAMAAVIVTSAAVSFGVLAWLRVPAFPQSAQGWLACIMLALVCTAFAMTAFLAGVARIGPVRGSTLSTLEVLTTVLVGAMFLREPLTVPGIIGGVMILIATVIIARSTAAAAAPAGAGAEAAGAPPEDPARAGAA